MTLEEFVEFYETRLDKDDFGDFEDIVNPLHPCGDLCAMLYLSKLLPTKQRDFIGAAEHDAIYFCHDICTQCHLFTEEDIIYLLRCGVYYDEEVDSLMMYV